VQSQNLTAGISNRFANWRDENSKKNAGSASGTASFLQDVGKFFSLRDVDARASAVGHGYVRTLSEEMVAEVAVPVHDEAGDG
jgi:hypothetical protein